MKTETGKRKVTTSLTLSEGVIRELGKTSESTGISRSELVELALRCRPCYEGLKKGLEMRMITVSNKIFNSLLKTKNNFDKSRKPPRDLSKEYDWDTFFHDLLLGEGVVAVEFVSVNGEPAENYTIIFLLGKYGYQYKSGHCTEISPVPFPTKEGVVYRMPARAFAQRVEVERIPTEEKLGKE